jgi:hypothetical protein
MSTMLLHSGGGKGIGKSGVLYCADELRLIARGLHVIS